jgi:hypothetical protein
METRLGSLNTLVEICDLLIEFKIKQVANKLKILVFHLKKLCKTGGSDGFLVRAQPFHCGVKNERTSVIIVPLIRLHN